MNRNRNKQKTKSYNKRSYYSRSKRGKKKGLGSMGSEGSSNPNSTKQKAIQATKSTLLDMVFGLAFGSVAGGIIGKPSVIVGAGVTGYGHYKNNSLARAFGIGMMAGANIFGVKSQAGFKLKEHYKKDAIKERLDLAIENLKSKFFLDSLGKNKSASGNKSGMEGLVGLEGLAEAYLNMQKMAQDPSYALDPNNAQSMLNLQALDALKQQVEQSGMQYQKQMNGLEGKADTGEDFIVISEPIY
jgi:hypothetical protein